MRQPAPSGSPKIARPPTARSSSPRTSRRNTRWCGSHPETGERTLVLGHFVKNFVGLSTEQSNGVFKLLQDHAIKLEYTTRWNWEAGDVAIWDNRATQHYAIADYDDQYRRLERITLAGDIPVNIHGERSRSIAGDASEYSIIEGASTLP